MIRGVDFVIERRPDGMHWIIFAPDSGHYYAYQERLTSYAENMLWMLFEIQDERHKQEMYAQANMRAAMGEDFLKALHEEQKSREAMGEEFRLAYKELREENAALKERNAWLEQRWEATHALLHKGE